MSKGNPINDDAHATWLTSDAVPPGQWPSKRVLPPNTRVTDGELAVAMSLRSPSVATAPAATYFSSAFTRALRARASQQGTSSDMMDRIKVSIDPQREGFDLLVVTYDQKTKEISRKCGRKPSLAEAVATLNQELFSDRENYVDYESGMQQVNRIARNFRATQPSPDGLGV